LAWIIFISIGRVVDCRYYYCRGYNISRISPYTL